eukprot:scaffold71884_cov72-Phaeocystis_antarctica.AAC.5
MCLTFEPPRSKLVAFIEHKERELRELHVSTSVDGVEEGLWSAEEHVVCPQTRLPRRSPPAVKRTAAQFRHSRRRLSISAHGLGLLTHQCGVGHYEQDVQARVQAAEVVNKFNRDQCLAQASAQVDDRVLGDGMLDTRLLVRPNVLLSGASCSTPRNSPKGSCGCAETKASTIGRPEASGGSLAHTMPKHCERSSRLSRSSCSPTARAVPLHLPDGTRNELTGASPCTATGTLRLGLGLGLGLGHLPKVDVLLRSMCSSRVPSKEGDDRPCRAAGFILRHIACPRRIRRDDE